MSQEGAGKALLIVDYVGCMFSKSPRMQTGTSRVKTSRGGERLFETGGDGQSARQKTGLSGSGVSTVDSVARRAGGVSKTPFSPRMSVSDLLLWSKQ